MNDEGSFLPTDADKESVATETKKLAMTIKEYAEQLGVSAGFILTAAREAHLDPEKDDLGRIVYPFEDMQQAFIEFDQRMRHKNVEHDAELFKRILPGLKAEISETLRKELDFMTAIKESKESRLTEVLGALKQLVIENREATTFLIKLLAQVNNAAIAGLSASAPIAAFERDGDHPPLADKWFDEESSGPSEVSPKELSTSNQKHDELARHVAQSPSGRRPQKEKKSASDEDVPPSGSEILDAMMASAAPVSTLQKKMLNKHRSVIDRVVTASRDELASLDEAERMAIDELLASFEELVSDVPHFKTFYSQLTNIKRWVTQKANDISPAIMFLALNRVSPGAVGAKDFLFMTELD